MVCMFISFWPRFHNILWKIFPAKIIFTTFRSPWAPATFEDSINKTNDFEFKFFVWNLIHDAKVGFLAFHFVDALLRLLQAFAGLLLPNFLFFNQGQGIIIPQKDRSFRAKRSNIHVRYFEFNIWEIFFIIIIIIFYLSISWIYWLEDHGRFKMTQTGNLVHACQLDIFVLKLLGG